MLQYKNLFPLISQHVLKIILVDPHNYKIFQHVQKPSSIRSSSDISVASFGIILTLAVSSANWWWALKLKPWCTSPGALRHWGYLWRHCDILDLVGSLCFIASLQNINEDALLHTVSCEKYYFYTAIKRAILFTKTTLNYYVYLNFKSFKNLLYICT